MRISTADHIRVVITLLAVMGGMLVRRGAFFLGW